MLDRSHSICKLKLFKTQSLTLKQFGQIWTILILPFPPWSWRDWKGCIFGVVRNAWKFPTDNCKAIDWDWDYVFRFWTVTNHWSISRHTPKFTEIGFNNSPLALIGTGDIPQLEIRSQTQLFLTTTHNLCTSSLEPGSIISDKRRTHWMVEMLNVIEYLYIWLGASGQECRVHSYIINWYHYQPSVTTSPWQIRIISN